MIHTIINNVIGDYKNMNKSELGIEIREVIKAISELERSNEPTTQEALKLAQDDLSYLLTLVDIDLILMINSLYLI